jgi:hypothetical protein
MLAGAAMAAAMPAHALSAFQLSLTQVFLDSDAAIAPHLLEGLKLIK